MNQELSLAEIKNITKAEKVPKSDKVEITKKDLNSKKIQSIELVPVKGVELLFDIAVTPVGEKLNKLQLRANKSIIISRNDFFSKHTNPPYIPSKAPNDTKIKELMIKYSQATLKEPHLHINLPQYGDKWAFPIHEFWKNKDENKNISEKLANFCNHYNIRNIIFKAEGLFDDFD